MQFNPNITIPDIKNVLGKYVDKAFKEESLYNIKKKIQQNQSKIKWRVQHEQKVHLTSLCLSYFGDSTTYKYLHSWIQKNMQDKLALQKHVDPGKPMFPITDQKVINKINRSKSNCTVLFLLFLPEGQPQIKIDIWQAITKPLRASHY